MIYVRLAGGLGNQLYQLAAAELLSQRFGMEYVPVVSGLGRYAVPRTPDSLLLFRSPRLNLKTNSRLQEIVLDKLRAGLWAPFFRVNDRNFSEVLCRQSLLVESLCLDGYFQYCWNMDRFSQVLAMSSVGDGATADDRPTNLCAIHVRGGDFLKVAQHQLIDAEYYMRCVEAAMNAGFHEFQVVTDDLGHAADITARISRVSTCARFQISQGASALDDFFRLMSAPARIIGNSTFSWWAAALDKRRAPTWSPERFIASKRRNFFLPWETVVPIHG